MSGSALTNQALRLGALGTLCWEGGLNRKRAEPAVGHREPWAPHSQPRGDALSHPSPQGLGRGLETARVTPRSLLSLYDHKEGN